ncbi:MAG TPA: flagellar filament capping protein FliD, partial [Firmicutes bacterium]|nr:flagellar filament capping protein FliD [Bacillota bacterium]
ISTGLDTQGIIDALMQVERRPQVIMQRNQQILTWKKEYWGEINTKLLAVKTAVANLLNREKLLAKKTTSSDEKVLTATADGSAASGQYTITVSSLATETVLLSGAGALGLGLGGKVDVAQPVNSDASKLGVKINSGTFTINGVTFTINSGDYLGTGNTADPLDIIGKINAQSGTTGVTASYDSDADKLVLTTSNGTLNLGGAGDTSNFLSATGLLTAPLEGGTTKRSVVHLGRINPDQTLAAANFATPVTDDGTGHGAFKINGVEIAYDVNADTLNKLITRINNSAANVIAAYDPTTDRLVLRSKATGTVSITVEEIAGKGNFLTAAGLTAAAGATQTLGSNAVFTVSGFNNDQPITRTSNSVSDVIAGVTLNLVSASATPVTVTVAQDVEAAKGVIKDFVAKYNDAISLINTRLGEKKVTGKAWEDMTDAERKSGIMRGESALSDLRFRLASVVTAPVPGAPALMDALTDLGIKSGVTTGDASVSTGENGALVLDEAKLDEVLKNTPELVADLFFKDADADGQVDKDANGVPTEQGVAVQLDYYLAQLTDTQSVLRGSVSVKAGVVPRQQDVLSGMIDDLQEQIDAFDQRMEQREADLVRQFTVMEQMVAQFQAQSAWLTQQIGKM